MESTESFQAEAVTRHASAPRYRAPVRSNRLSFENVIPLSHLFGSLRRKLLRTQAKFADIIADRSSLLAKIEILEHEIQRVQKFAHYDELTGLPNRRLLEDRYALAVARSERQRDNVALLFIDIDRFKSINDAFGHDFADRVLQKLALRLTGSIRASDTACRYGGDEFIVLLSGNQRRADAIAAATKIRELLSVPFRLDSRTVDLKVSIGMALYPIDGPELGSLLKAADTEMYRRKKESTGDSKSKRDRVMENEAFTNEGAPPAEESRNI